MGWKDTSGKIYFRAAFSLVLHQLDFELFMDKIVNAYIDESGNTDGKNNNRALIIAAIVSDDLVPIQRSIKAAERKIRLITQDNRELKAYRQSLHVRQIFFKCLSKTKFDIYYVLFDLASIRNFPYNVEIIYAFGMSLLCQNIVNDYHSVQFILDQRYSSEKQRDHLDTEIRNKLMVSGIDQNNITIIHQNSIEIPLLRAVDYIAYELYQKHKNADNCYEVIQNHEKHGVNYVNISWSKIKKESKTPLYDHPEL